MPRKYFAAYRPGVGVMLLNQQKHILLCRRIGATTPWQMPQGSIDRAAELRAAALRVLRRDIGTDNVVVLAESQRWYRYEVPIEYARQKWSGRHRWFLMLFKGQDSDIKMDAENPKFDRWIWVPPDHAPDLVIPFKRNLYRNVLREFQGAIQSFRLSS